MVGPISAVGPNQPKLIELHWPWFEGAKLDSKIGLYFTHRNGPIFRAKTDLSDLQCDDNTDNNNDGDDDNDADNDKMMTIWNKSEQTCQMLANLVS